ncbi:PREDICTED: glycerophosphocholine phosphodiesterase GPCPD1-like [Buceros rhinoceros silvestris]|uniref:glycerophosphocholine phosphodiesterase GPCPD1-like n=1 Tax=Buceros rhinoceros silvestris TaxID=175836 RepID=UPI00052806C0|nr:PREDICTED: glycerophosphocholine phosphodiesterase GPCPD1-like [Buceros rhinoceros silvestris]
MTSSQVTFEVRGPSVPGEVFAICGSCSALGNWNPQAAVVLQTDDRQLWKTTVELPRGVPVWYRYFKGYFLEPKKMKLLLTMDTLESVMVLKLWILGG